MSKKAKPLIAILLCTYNGEEFLAEQLDSIVEQTHENFVLWASDDGSTDGTIKMLEDYQKKLPAGKLNIIRGPGKGSVTNFLSLLCDERVKGDYFSFSDQDDIWEKDKLSRALSILQDVSDDIPALYGARTLTVSVENKEIGFSPIFAKEKGFKNALVQSFAGGNTMLMNSQARVTLQKSGIHPVISHDWWAYQLISGAGGEIFYDKISSLRYRQHPRNQIGENTSWLARITRIKMLLKGEFRKWNDGNVAALSSKKYLLSSENQTILNEFDLARKSWVLKRLLGFRKAGIYRQTMLGNIGLIVAAILNRI